MPKFISDNNKKMILPYGLELEKDASYLDLIELESPITLADTYLFGLIRRELPSIIGESYLRYLLEALDEDSVRKYETVVGEKLLLALSSILGSRDKIDAVKEQVAGLYDKIGDELKASLDYDDFLINMLLVVSAIFLLQRRPVYRLDYKEKIDRLNKDYKMVLREIMFLEEQVNSFVASVIAALGKEKKYAYAESFRNSARAFFQDDPESPKKYLDKFIERINLDGLDTFQVISHEVELLDEHVSSAKFAHDRLRRPDQTIIYGSIHWLHKVWGIRLRTACAALVRLRELPKYNRMTEWRTQTIAVDETTEKLRTSYIRYTKGKRVTPLHRGGSNLCNKISEGLES